jgi:hypothetical protein
MDQSSIDYFRDFETSAARRRRIREGQLIPQWSALDIGAQRRRFVRSVKHLGHGFNALGVDTGKAIHVFEDTAQIVNHAFDFVRGQVEVREVSDVSHFGFGQFHEKATQNKSARMKTDENG